MRLILLLRKIASVIIAVVIGLAFLAILWVGTDSPPDVKVATRAAAPGASVPLPPGSMHTGDLYKHVEAIEANDLYREWWEGRVTGRFVALRTSQGSFDVLLEDMRGSPGGVAAGVSGPAEQLRRLKPGDVVTVRGRARALSLVYPLNVLVQDAEIVSVTTPPAPGGTTP